MDLRSPFLSMSGLWVPDVEEGLEVETHLDLNAYDELENPAGESFSTSETYLYLGGTKQMWCAIPGFPDSLSAITRPPPPPPDPPKPKYVQLSIHEMWGIAPPSLKPPTAKSKYV